MSQAAGFGRGAAELEANGFLTREGLELALRCHEYLQHLRIRMHLMLGRREDRLLFDYQNTLAAQYGFESTPAKRDRKSVV